VVVRSSILIALLSLFSVTATAEAFDWAPQFNIGDSFPIFSLVDQDNLFQTNDVQTNNVQTSVLVNGENGYLIQFNRSVVW